jgi:hypothetical protein
MIWPQNYRIPTGSACKKLPYFRQKVAKEGLKEVAEANSK